MGEQQPIIIVGFMGAGKTTIAAALARLLHCGMVDLDERITRHEGRTPRQIIERDGEPEFRDIETRALKQLLENEPAQVIAAGGGTWVLERNRDLIEEHQGITIWLRVPFAICWQRIVAQGDERPLARSEQAARNLFSEREPLYQLASLHVEAGEGKLSDEIAATIAGAIAHEKMPTQHSSKR